MELIKQSPEIENTFVGAIFFGRRQFWHFSHAHFYLGLHILETVPQRVKETIGKAKQIIFNSLLGTDHL